MSWSGQIVVGNGYGVSCAIGALEFGRPANAQRRARHSPQGLSPATCHPATTASPTSARRPTRRFSPAVLSVGADLTGPGTLNSIWPGARLKGRTAAVKDALVRYPAGNARLYGRSRHHKVPCSIGPPVRVTAQTRRTPLYGRRRIRGARTIDRPQRAFGSVETIRWTLPPSSPFTVPTRSRWGHHLSEDDWTRDCRVRRPNSPLVRSRTQGDFGRALRVSLPSVTGGRMTMTCRPAFAL